MLWRAAIASLCMWATSSVSAATLPQTAWTQTAFTGNNCNLFGAVDPAGNAYVAGYSDGVILGTNTNGQSTAFLAKFNPSGQLLWANMASDPSLSGAKLAVDASGDVYMTRDDALQKYNTNGKLLWSIAGILNPNGVALDQSGNIFVGGYSNSQQAFVSKFNPSGQILWTRTPESAPQSYADAIAVDAFGDVIVGGENDYSASPLQVNGFAAKYDPQGNLLWNTQLGPTPGDTQTYGVGVGPTGAIFLSGVGPSLFGEPAGGTPGFLIKYDSSGNLEWINRYSEHNGTPIAVDPAGSLYVGAGYNLLKYSPSGNQLGQIPVTSAWDETSVAWANGNVYATFYSQNPSAGILTKVVCDNYWRVDANGNWSNTGNWSGATPNAVDAAANFYNNVTAPRAITVDAPVTVGAVAFCGTNQYTIAGSNAITMQVSSGIATISDLGGSHLVSAPLVLASTTVVAVANPGDTLTLSGQVSGSGALGKSGSGTLTLSGANTYSGGTTVSQGSLVVAGSLGNTAVTVGGGATLGGTGSIAGSVVVQGGSTAGTQGAINLADGLIGTLTLSDPNAADTVLTLGGPTAGNLSVLTFEVGAIADRIRVAAGKVAVNPGGSLINIIALSGFGPGTYDLMDFPNGQAGGLGYLSLATTSLDGHTLSLQSTPTAEQLVVSVPEPSTFVLFGAGGLALLAHACRRRKAA